MQINPLQTLTDLLNKANKSGAFDLDEAVSALFAINEIEAILNSQAQQIQEKSADPEAEDPPKDDFEPKKTSPKVGAKGGGRPHPPKTPIKP